MLTWRFLVRVLRPCVVASLLASLGVLIVFEDWRSLVWESFVVSLCYSICIALFASVLGPFVAQRVGRPGPTLTLALSSALLASAAIGSLVAGGLLFAAGFGLPGPFWRSYWLMFRVTAALAVVCGLASHVYEHLTAQLRETRVQEERAKKLALEARLASLESRIRPHFLFNTLNAISALIPVDPQRAEDLVGRLAALLRSSLNSTQQGLIPLASELEIVGDYLDIEKGRLGNRLRCTVTVPDGTRELLVPPFSVQCLVENSVKHGIAPSETGGEVGIAAQRETTGLRIDVSDSGSGFDLSCVDPGHGLDNLISRLDTQFGPAARVEVARRHDRCVVSLIIPLDSR